MKNELIEFYNYLIKNKSLKEEIVNLKEDFLVDDIYLLAGLGLVKEIKERILKLDKVILLIDYFKSRSSKIIFVDRYLVNSYNEINGYLIYDFLSLEYDMLVNRIESLLKL